MAAGLILIVLLIAIPIAILVRRFRQGEPPEQGGSLGRQLFGRRDDDWGPKSSK